MVTDNRPGAAGSMGVALASRATPNGYTICLVSASHTVSAAVNPKLPYHLTRDLQPITQATSLFYVLVVNPSVPVKSMKELIAFAKDNPAKLNSSPSSRARSTTPCARRISRRA